MHRLLALSTLLACTAFGGAAGANTAYVSNEKGNTISVINLDKMETVATVPVGEDPVTVAVSVTPVPAGTLAFDVPSVS